jgi:hypothetical protein
MCLALIEANINYTRKTSPNAEISCFSENNSPASRRQSEPLQRDFRPQIDPLQLDQLFK